jgi:uncharacterized protein YigA (DUF484 family)
MTPEFFEQAAHMDNLLVLTKEQAAATAKALRHLAALERENARLRAVIADLLETDANWIAAADWNAALERAREALEPPAAGVPGLESAP